MVDKKKQTVILTSPVGVVGPFAKLVVADEYQGQKKYKVTLLLDPEDAEKITDSPEFLAAQAEAEKLYAEAQEAARKKLPKGKNPPEFEPAYAYFTEVDRETQEETGRTGFRFASGAEFTDKRTGKVVQRSVPFFDAKGKPIPKDARQEPWGGSRVRIGYSLFPYANVGAKNYGVSLRLEAVKIIELRAKGAGGDASRFGFGDEEEGYESDGEATGAMGGDESDSSASDNSDSEAAPTRF